MNIGEMKFRIELLEETDTASGNVFDKTEYVPIKKIWSAVNRSKRERKYVIKKETEENNLFFTVRYQEISTDTRIRFQNKTYEIKSIEDVGFERRFLEIEAKEVV